MESAILSALECAERHVILRQREEITRLHLEVDRLRRYINAITTTCATQSNEEMFFREESTLRVVQA